MGLLRWILALATVAYALWSAVPPVTTVFFKLGRMPPAMATGAQRYVPLMQVTPWWQVALWLFIVLTYLFAAFRVVTRPREAFIPFLLAAVLDAANWYISKQRPVYDKTFTPQELMLDYVILGGLVVGAILYYAASRVRRKRVQPAVLTG
jgi:hypothetical protein